MKDSLLSNSWKLSHKRRKKAQNESMKDDTQHNPWNWNDDGEQSYNHTKEQLYIVPYERETKAERKARLKRQKKTKRAKTMRYCDKCGEDFIAQFATTCPDCVQRKNANRKYYLRKKYAKNKN